MSYSIPEEYEDAIAIIGMAGRFPGAKNLQEFWQNLCDGVTSTTFFSDEALIKAGHKPDLLRHPNFVPAGAVLSDIEYFDAGFFAFTPKEASRMDPQHRFFMECAWEALEEAGIDPFTYDKSIGVYAGTSMSSYQWINLRGAFEAAEGMGNLQTLIANDKDYLATHLSYKLNLTGPSLSIQTACSTSLVAVHVACQSLLNGECALALTGGVTIRLPQGGYLYQEGGIFSPDGYCRPFDSKALGTFGGNGVGIVVLKRLADALQDGDCIDAIIRGSAINNDGQMKIGYTAPSKEGQARVITEALAVAGLTADSISYIEAHGTATPIGDPIEIAALKQVFADSATPCAIGSVKSNIGHLESAAGIVGLIKTILALKQKTLPPSLHFEHPNPKIDFATTPFYVNTKRTEWKSNGMPRRAGVSSFGVGGTNAHLILEEAFPTEQSEQLETNNDRAYLLPLSARHPQALKELAASYQKWLTNDGRMSKSTLLLRDICYSASLRRCHHTQRLAVVGHSYQELIDALGTLAEQPATGLATKPHTLAKQIVFVFSGHGSQWCGMGRQLFALEPIFRETLEQCDQAIQRAGGFISILAELNAEESASRLDEVDILQPCLFAIQVSLAALWRSWGIQPAAVVGHSMGEVAAAYVAGALTLDDAARVICWRSRLIKRVSGQGVTAFVALSLPEAEQLLIAHQGVSVAATNGPQATVLSGEPAAVKELLQSVEQQGVFCRLVKMDYAAHSHQMDPLRSDLVRALNGLQPRSASIPFYSTVEGDIIDGLTLDATYWARNLRQPVLFSSATERLIEKGYGTFLELSAHPILLPAIKAQFHSPEGVDSLAQRGLLLPSMRRHASQQMVMLNSLATFYQLGIEVQWHQLYATGGQFVRLPSYPWQRERYWVENRPAAQEKNPIVVSKTRHPSLIEQAGNLTSSYMRRVFSSVLQSMLSGNKKAVSKAPAQLTDQNGPASASIRSTLLSAAPEKRYALLETYLSQQVGQVLGVTTLDVEQPLGQLGIDSLMTVVLRNRVQDDLGIKVSAASFLQNPTVSELTTQLLLQLTDDSGSTQAKQRANGAMPSGVNGIESDHSPLVPIQPQGDKRPFFCVHPWVGVVYPYYQLAMELGPDQPFYGLQSGGMYGQIDRSIEEMATHYIQVLRTVTKGPYLLGGWSFGGLVAFEMAQQLQRAGEEVALLALLDTSVPIDDTRSNVITSVKFISTIAARHIWPYVYDYFSLMNEQNDFAKHKQALNGNRLEQTLSKQVGMVKNMIQEVSSLTNRESTTRRIFNTLRVNGQANFKYIPQSYAGRITLFRVAEQLVPDDEQRALGWDNLAAGGVEIKMIPGNHLNFLRTPHVQFLAAQLKSCIEQAQAQ